VDLSGKWRCATSTPEVDRSGADPDYDDSQWELVEVPGHWGQHPAFADTSGPVVYRRRFTIDPPDEGERLWLRLDGVLAEADIWLDGQHVGETSVYYAPHRFDITEIVANSDVSSHLLTIEVSYSSGQGDDAKKSVVGSLGSGPLASIGTTGGIWRSVGIDRTGPVSIVHARLTCVDADPERATLQIRLELDAAEATDAQINTSVVGPDGSTAGGTAIHSLARGPNHIEWTTRVDNPRLWWPAQMGEQPRYDVGVSITDSTNTVSDRRHWRTGLRTVRTEAMSWLVNNRRIFIQAIACGPQGPFLADISTETIRRDLQAAKDAGLNMVRVYGHVSHPSLYDIADELGLLLWQDLPLIGTYATRARTRAKAAAKAAVDILSHHPSIVVWSAHNEPNGPPIPEPSLDANPASRLGVRLGRHLLPSWNRSILDPILRRELRSADPSRPVITRSGTLPSLTDLTGSDSHLWLGWRFGVASDLAELLKKWPRLGSFVGAIGSQSVGLDDWDENEPSWPGAEVGAFQRYIPRRAYADGLSWAQGTQAYQAEVIRAQIETLRRLKYKPTGGFCVMSLADSVPEGGFGVFTFDRVPKPAYSTLADACRPVVVIADAPPSVVSPGQVINLAVHVVSELPEPLPRVAVKAQLSLGAWRLEREWTGEIESDACSFVADLEFVVPEITGQLIIDLELNSASHACTNRYITVSVPTAEVINPFTTRK